MKPAVRRGNLKVATRALAWRVVFEQLRAVGMEYIEDGEKKIARASREVILSGGVINSPQLLMLSGVGNPDELSQHGISVRVPLKGVGKNLQDHIAAAIPYRRKSEGPFVKNLRVDRLAVELAKAYCFGTGFAPYLPSGVGGFLKTAGKLLVPDVQMLFHAGPLGAEPHLRPFKKPVADGFSSRAVLLRPESRGWLKLASADPVVPVRIHQNFLATDKDWNVLREGMRLLRDIGRQGAMSPFVGKELLQD